MTHWKIMPLTVALFLNACVVPQFEKAKMAAQETAAIQAIMTIHKAQVQYISQYGRWAASLAELGPPASGSEGPSAANLIGADLAGGLKHGYRFTLGATQGGYTIDARPVRYQVDGVRSFYSDQSMVIRESRGPEPATVASEPLK